MGIPTKGYGIDTFSSKTASQLRVYSMVAGGAGVAFPAFLTDFSQTFDSTWNQEEVYGRVDPIATFQGTKRTISVSFSCPAGDIQQASDNLTNCGTLMSFLYPAYTDVKVTRGRGYGGGDDQRLAQSKVASGRVISKAPLCKVRFSNLINSSDGGRSGAGGLLGYFTSITWSPQIDMGYFTFGPAQLFPKVINLSFTFNALHQHGVGFTDAGQIIAPNFPF